MNLEPPREETYREPGTSGRRLGPKSPIPDAHDSKLGRTVGPQCGLSLVLGLGIGSLWASLVTQMVKNLPAMPETQVQSLGWEDFLDKGTSTHSSILA